MVNFGKYRKYIGALFSVYFARLLLSLIPIISLPLFLRVLGKEDWTQLALFQTIGAFLLLLTDLSWSVDGHGKSRLGPGALKFIQIQKYFVFLTISVITVLLAVSSFESVGLNSWLGMMAIASMGLSNWWYTLAARDSKKYIYSEVAPRVVPLLVALFFVSTEKHVSWYLITFILLNIVFCWNGSLNTLELSDFSKALNEICKRLKITFSRILQSSYFIFSLPILSILDPKACFGFALIERVYRFCMTTTLPLQDFLIMNKPKGNKFAKSWRGMLVFQPLIAVLVYILLCNPVSFHFLIGTENPNQALTIAFFPLVILVAINRVLMVRFTSNQAEDAKLNFAYLSSALTYIFLAYPLTTVFGPYGIITSSVFAELVLLLTLFNRNLGKDFKDLQSN